MIRLGYMAIEPLQLERAASRLKTVSNKVSNSKNALNRIREQTENAWISDYTQEYCAYVAAIQSQLGLSVNSINTLASRLLEIAGEVRRLEEEYERKMAEEQKLPGGGGGRF